MMLVVLLDSGPLGMVTNPKGGGTNERCKQWLSQLLQNRAHVIIPEIVDYEIRRELLRGDKTNGLRRLDSLIQALNYEPITGDVMRTAARFWADARKSGKATASDLALDCDMILAAHAEVVRRRGRDPIIATTNVRHLSLFASTDHWSKIS